MYLQKCGRWQREYCGETDLMGRRRYLMTGMTPNPGGVEAYIMNLVRNMDEDKVIFDFLVNFDGAIAFEKELRARGSRVIHLAGRRKHPWCHYRDYQCFFRKYGNDYDGIYCNLLSLANIDDLRYARKYGISRIIAHAHNSSDSGWDLLGIRKKLHLLHQKTLQAYADLCFACSRQAGQWMFGIGTDFEVIHNGIDMGRFCFDQDRRRKARNRWNIPPDTVVFGTIGRLDIQKNPLFLPEVFYHIKEYYCNSVFLHVGEGVLREEMEKKIREYDLEESYRLEGACADSSEYYQAMDVFLLPSLFEGLSISMVEAQACDLPCFVSDTVSEETKLMNERYRPLPLNAGAKVWAKEIHRYLTESRSRRTDRSEEIMKAGYDIREVSKKMEERLYHG